MAPDKKKAAASQCSRRPIEVQFVDSLLGQKAAMYHQVVLGGVAGFQQNVLRRLLPNQMRPAGDRLPKGLALFGVRKKCLQTLAARRIKLHAGLQFSKGGDGT